MESLAASFKALVTGGRTAAAVPARSPVSPPFPSAVAAGGTTNPPAAAAAASLLPLPGSSSGGQAAPASEDPPGAAEITAKVAAAWEDAMRRAEVERCAPHFIPLPPPLGIPPLHPLCILCPLLFPTP